MVIKTKQFYKHRCGCGCNKKIQIYPHHKYQGIPKYIKGHFFKIYDTKGENNPFFMCHHTEEVKQKIRDKRKLQIITPETKKKIGDALRNKRQSNEHIKNKIDARRKMGWFKDIIRAKKNLSLSHIGIYPTKEECRKRSILMKKHWSNPPWDNKKRSRKISNSLSKGYASGKITNNNQYVRGYYNNEWYDSSYELEYMKILDKKNIKWTKKHKIIIPYLWNKNIKHYIPDFLEYRKKIMITEVKGRITENDIIKHQAIQKYCKKKDYDYRMITKRNGKWMRLKNGENINTKNAEVITYGKGLSFN